MPKAESYKQATCCDLHDCHLLDLNEGEVCWGQVTVIAEDYTEDDYWWIHSCEGHEDCIYSGPYKSEKQNGI